MASTPPQIPDVTAEGIGLCETLRGDFVSYLNHHDSEVAGLVRVLQKRALNPSASGPDRAGTVAPAR